MYTYGTSGDQPTSDVIRRTHTVRGPVDSTLWPGDYIDIAVPSDMLSPDDMYCIEPHTNFKFSNSWPQTSFIYSVNHSLGIPYLTDEPIAPKYTDYMCNDRTIYVPSKESSMLCPTATKSKQTGQHHSDIVRIDSDGLLIIDMKEDSLLICTPFENVIAVND